jgi:hypothetical protein
MRSNRTNREVAAVESSRRKWLPRVLPPRLASFYPSKNYSCEPNRDELLAIPTAS